MRFTLVMIIEDKLVFDARGNGGGMICPTITGDHQNRITDYTAIVLERNEVIQLCEERSTCGE